MQKLILILPFLLAGCATPDFLRNPRIVAQERQEAADKAAYQAAAQEFNKTCNLYLTADEQGDEQYYVAQLYKGDISCEGLINAFSVYIGELTQGKAKLKDPTKNNKDLSFLLYNDIGVRLAGMEEFLLKEQKFRSEQCYGELEQMKTKLEDIRGEIDGKFYALEKADFMKRSGLKVSPDPIYPLALIAGITSMEPDPKTIYKFGGVKVLQVLNEGILISSYDGGIAYIKTLKGKNYVDGKLLYDLYVLPNGTKRYSNVLGAQKTVYSFKEIDLEALYKRYSKKYLFFPSVKSQDELPLTSNEMILKLITKK